MARARFSRTVGDSDMPTGPDGNYGPDYGNGIPREEPANGINPVVSRANNTQGSKGWNYSDNPFPEYNDPNYQIPGATLPGQQRPGQVNRAFGSQYGTARDFLNNFQSNSDKLYQGYETQARGDLAKGMRKVKNDFNSRGLLGSGIQADAGDTLANTVNTGLRQKRADINSSLLDNLSTLEGNAASTGNLIAQAGPDTANPYMGGVQSNLGLITGDQTLANNAYGQLAGGGLSVLGTGLASLMRGAKS